MRSDSGAPFLVAPPLVPANNPVFDDAEPIPALPCPTPAAPGAFLHDVAETHGKTNSMNGGSSAVGLCDISRVASTNPGPAADAVADAATAASERGGGVATASLPPLRMATSMASWKCIHHQAIMRRVFRVQSQVLPRVLVSVIQHERGRAYGVAAWWTDAGGVRLAEVLRHIQSKLPPIHLPPIVPWSLREPNPAASPRGELRTDRRPI